MTKLWVDYTNWKNIREWREITPMSPIVRCVGQANNDDITNAAYPRKGEEYWGMHVLMADRDHMPRVLHIRGIHGFAEGNTKPKPWRDEQPDTFERE